MTHTCPLCKSKGRVIKPVTLQAHVMPARLEQLPEHEGWRLCTSESCRVIYFRGDQVVNLGETRRVPFHKSRDENRLVCFCFKHSVATIKADVEKNNESTIRTSIKAQCKEGLDDCERRNPQGRCCLGHVGQVVKQATSNAAHQEHHVESETELCGALKEKTSDAFSSTKNDSVTHSSLLVSVGASATAMLSSACCWLPLVARFLLNFV